MLLVGETEDRQKILTTMSTIRNHLTTLGKFALLLFMDREDDVSGQAFLSKALAFAENISFCCEKMSMADRPIVDLATHKEMVTWIAYSTPESRCKPTGLRSAAVFKTLKLMPPGQTLNKVAYRELELRLNQYAVQMHVDHVNNIMATPQLDREQYLELGVDPRNMLLFFPQLTPDKVLLLADQHGTKPRLQIQPISWYRGGDDVRFWRAYDGFITKEYRDKWAPFMFMPVLSIFLDTLDGMIPESCVRISLLGSTKLRISLTDQGWTIFKAKYREVLHAIRISFKDSSRGQF